MTPAKIYSLESEDEELLKIEDYISQSNSIAQFFGDFDHETDSFFDLGRILW